MKIEILGDGCAKCKGLKSRVEQAVVDLGIDAEIGTVIDPLRIAELQALSLPQLAIDGKLAPPGDLTTVAGVKKVLSRPEASWQAAADQSDGWPARESTGA